MWEILENLEKLVEDFSKEADEFIRKYKESETKLCEITKKKVEKVENDTMK